MMYLIEASVTVSLPLLLRIDVLLSGVLKVLWMVSSPPPAIHQIPFYLFQFVLHLPYLHPGP